MAKQTFFVTGTDTDCGKTFVSCALLTAAANQGMITLAMKPLAAGCDETADGLRNEDAQQLMSAMTADLSYEQVNPIALRSPIAPHIAAEEESRRLSVSRLAGFCQGVMLSKADLLVIEGAGGWRVPLNQRETIGDLAAELRVPVILVVGVKLGCISHALLTAESIERQGVTIAGWVANQIDGDMSRVDENILMLERSLKSPCLGVIPWLGEQEADRRLSQAAGCINLTKLLG